MPALVSALNSVDFPTFGKPTIPHFKLMTHPRFEAGKFMRCACAALLALATSVALAAAPPAAHTLALGDQEQLDATEFATAWYDPHGTATLEQVMQGTAGASFQPLRAEQIQSLGEGQLWLRWRLMRPRSVENGWLIVFPMPALDRVTLHQQNERGF